MKKFVVPSVGVLALFASSVHAALPSGISTGINGLNADLTSLVDLVWPVVIASVAAVVIIKLFKRFTNKI